jgi:hypothetical protein
MEKNVYEVIPILKELLVTKYFSQTLVGLSSTWFDNKCNLCFKYGLNEGVNEVDIELINKALAQLAVNIEQLKVQVQENMKDMDYQNGISEKIRDLAKMINLPCFIKTYTSFSINTFRSKIGHFPNTNGEPRLFTEKDIHKYNKGIDGLYVFISSLKVKL